MRIQIVWLPLLLYGAVIFSLTECRRVRIEPQEEEDISGIQYYAAEPREDQQQQVVLVSSSGQYNGLYGQPTAASRSGQENYIPQSRKSLTASVRTKEPSKAPPVQTIRNYNKVNDDGSFTFGYEADDGSFKEETRGTDCVVRGKYGYVDPDGNKREFTYVSGNPCDPNAPKEEQEEPQEQENETDNGPANYPTRPVRPVLRPTVTVAPKPVTLFQSNYDQSEEEQPEPEQVLRQQPVRRPTYITRPQYVQQTATEEAQVYQRPQLVPSTTPASVLYRQSVTPINITPRPVTPTPQTRTQLPATTYRPQLLQVSVTPRPSLLYTKQTSSPTPSPRGNLDFDAEFQKFQQENNILSPTPRPKAKTIKEPTSSGGSSGQIYSSALVFDPASGQYKTQLYQTLPQTEGDFTLNQRLQPYVHQPQRPPFYPTHLRQTPPPPPQALYQQQQAELQFQNSAHLYAQQQKVRQQQHQQQQQHHQHHLLQHQQQQQQQQLQRPNPIQSQQLYYIQPSVDQSGPLATGQIDAFLRGHNIQF